MNPFQFRFVNCPVRLSLLHETHEGGCRGQRAARSDLYAAVRGGAVLPHQRRAPLVYRGNCGGHHLCLRHGDHKAL